MHLSLKRPILLLALAGAAGAGAGGAAVQQRALEVQTVDHFIHPDIDVYFRDGPIRGILNARQIGESRTVRVFASLHRLTPGTTYRVLVSARPCSRPDVAAARILSVEFTTGRAAEDAFAVRRSRRRGSLRDLRSVRILADSGERFEQVSCITGSYDSGTGTLT